MNDEKVFCSNCEYYQYTGCGQSPSQYDCVHPNNMKVVDTPIRRTKRWKELAVERNANNRCPDYKEKEV